jgi:tetratricopeptide (TPR) repeat protein
MITPELASAAQSRHRECFLGKLTASGNLGQADLVAERPNIIAAWRSAAEVGDCAALLRAAEPLAQLLPEQGLASAIHLLTETATTLRDRPAQTEALGVVLYHLVRFLGMTGQHERGVAVAEELIRAAWASQSALNLGRGYLARGMINVQRRQWAEAWADLEAAEDLVADGKSNAERMVLAHSLLERATLIDVQQLTPDDSFARSALVLYRALGEQAWQAVASMRLGNYYRRASDYARALACRREALALAQAAGDRSTEVRVCNDLGEDLIHLGCYEEARAMLEHGMALARKIGFWRMVGFTLEGLARAWHHLGNQKQARACIAEALDLDRKYQLNLLRGYILTTLGYAYESEGDLLAAREAYAASLDWWDEAHTEARLEPRAGLLRVALAQGQLDSALAEAEQILPVLSYHGLSDALEPMRVYWSCYRALEAAADLRAHMVLGLAQRLLRALAERIEDDGLRHCFLMNVLSHRRLINAPEPRLYHRELILDVAPGYRVSAP